MFIEAISSGTGAELVATLLANDKTNLIVETSAVLNTGLTRGDVVKFSPTLSKWVACDGTVTPDTTDIIGIVEYASGTTGQIRLSGVYQDENLSTLGAFYCQSDGTLGSVETKVFIGRVTSTGKLCMPGGGGGGIQAATVDTIGGIMVGAGLHITTDGLLSNQHGSQMFTVSGTFTVPTGVTTVYVTGVGAGGGGGGGGAEGTGAGGGGAGQAVLKYPLSVTTGQIYTITIGQGGTGHTGYQHAAHYYEYGNTGGTSSFGSLLSLVGGSGGSNYNSNSEESIIGVNGNSSLLNATIVTSPSPMGAGATSLFGKGGRNPSHPDDGAGTIAGRGAGGAGGANVAYASGYSGGNGFILVEW